MRITTTILSCALLMLVTADVAAQKRERRPRGERRAKILERFDADKDGKLSVEERRTLRETLRKERPDRAQRRRGEGVRRRHRIRARRRMMMRRMMRRRMLERGGRDPQRIRRPERSLRRPERTRRPRPDARRLQRRARPDRGAEAERARLIEEIRRLRARIRETEKKLESAGRPLRKRW